MSRGPRVRVSRGIYRDAYGFEVRVQVKRLKDRTRFPSNAQREEMKSWQDAARARLRRQASAAPHGPFVDEAARYLKAVASMPTFEERQQHVKEWCEAFGHRRLDSLTPGEIRAQLEGWRTLHGWSASALNHRRTALQHVYRVLYGRSAPNPVRDVPRFREPDAQPRGQSWPLVRRILRSMPPSVTRLRLALIMWTGLPHSTLMRVTRESVDFEHRTLARPGRRKGAGTRLQLVPLTRRAVWYFKLLDRSNGWGEFSTSSMRGCWLRALERIQREAEKSGEVLNLPSIRPYDLRHSFGSLVYERTHDLQATAVLMGHASLTTTRRYTLTAVPAVLTTAVAKIEAKPNEKVSESRTPTASNALRSPAKLLTYQKTRP